MPRVAVDDNKRMNLRIRPEQKATLIRAAALKNTDLTDFVIQNALREAKMSEINEPFFSKPMGLLAKVKGIQFVKPDRPDECCGFGGTFSVFEEPVSARMGYDKVNDHHRAGAEYIVSADMSCMMHQQGCALRLGLPIKFIHVAQVLNGARA